jgi:hypothetical protein
MYKKFFKEYFKKVLNYKGRNIYDTEHSIERFKERMPGLDLNIYYTALKQGIDKILKDYKDERNQFIVASEKYGFGIQIDWRSDLKNPKDKTNHGYSATTLDPKENKLYTKNDKKLFVEQVKKYGVVKNTSEGRKEKVYYNIPLKNIQYFRLEHLDYLKEDMIGFDVFMEYEEIFRTFEIIKVD